MDDGPHGGQPLAMRHNHRRCRQRRERELVRELLDFELAHDLDEADSREAAIQAAWHCYLYGPCAKCAESMAGDTDANQ